MNCTRHAAAGIDLAAKRPDLLFEFARCRAAVLRPLQKQALQLWFRHFFGGPGETLLAVSGRLDQFVHHGHDPVFHRGSPPWCEMVILGTSRTRGYAPVACYACRNTPSLGSEQ